MDLERPHFRTTSTGSSSSATTTTTTGELFICFTSRLSASSSSMKLTKSILSPGRAARDGGGGGPVSLSSSLSRRLRTNGSLKGGASPFFTSSATGKKRGCGFENPEPSSPKVTCIGQVRVKTKKKVKQSRSLSKRRSGEVMSFRKIEHGNSGDRDHHQSQEQRYSNASGGAHYQQQQQQQPECLPLRNQRWVHLPISICEALSCLFPCKSSCFSTAGGEETEKAAAAAHEKHNDATASGDERGCGAVFARWMVSVNDGEGGKRREIELVVGGGDEEEEEERVSMRSSRRHVFEDFEVKDDRIEVKGQINEEKEEEEGGRVSICIPPKNALLLMRCRSDPMKMADLATRFSWDAKTSTHNHHQEDIKEEEEEENEVVVVSKEEECDQGNKNEVFEQESNQEEVSDEAAEAKMEMEQVAADIVNAGGEELVIINSIDEKMVDDEEEKEIEELQQEILGNLQLMFSQEEEEEEEEVESNMSSFEHLLDQENPDHYQQSINCPIEEEEVQDNSNLCHLSSPSTTESDEEINVDESNEEAEESNISDKVSILEIINADEHHILKLEPAAQITTENGVQEEEEEQVTVILPKESGMVENRENEEPASKIEEEEPKKKVLPECLLLMMCEPKLSMEVSKETWVCSTDFVRWLPERPRKPVKSAKSGGGCDHAPPPKRRLSIDSKLKPVAAHAPPSVAEDGYRYQHYQPPRSSCSLPAAAAAASMATMIEQKLVNAVGYEPFVLTRCKSEPMRSAAAKLIPESCFWKNAVTKLEPHGRAALGVGAAGVGF